METRRWPLPNFFPTGDPRGAQHGLPGATRFPPPTALTPPPLSPPPPQAIKKSKKLAKRKTLKFAVDCSQPVDDGIMDAASFVSRERGAPGLDGWG